MSNESAKQDEPVLEEEQSLMDLPNPEHELDGQEEQRYDPRTRLVQIGKLQIGREKFDCFIVDLSRKGTKIRTLEPLERELSDVKLHIAEIGVFDAEVRWIDGSEIGLLLHGEIEAPEEHESADIQEVLRIQNAQ